MSVYRKTVWNKAMYMSKYPSFQMFREKYYFNTCVRNVKRDMNAL